MRSIVTVFPFDLFGGAGTGAGARLLADAVQELLDDTEVEKRPCRADCLRENVELRECAFDTLPQIRDWRKTGRTAAKRVLKAGDFLLWLGGNHLSVLPVLEELGRDTCVIQFDAHLDVYAFHDNIKELTHGNFLRHFETPRPTLVNVGHRDLFITNDEISETFEAMYSAEDVARDADAVALELRARVGGAKRIWIDLDVDAFDPSAMPAVQQPLPFGLTGPTFLKLFDAIWSEKVVGVSISEFDPGCDVRDTGLNLLGWFVEFLLLKVHTPKRG